MGKGYQFICKKCKKKYTINLGSGMALPLIYEETIDEIKQGIWGNEYKEILSSDPLVAPNVEMQLYSCRTCERWNVEKIMNLYAPNNPESIKGRQYGTYTVEELGYVPFVAPWELKEDYHIIKRRVHYCKCGKRMHMISDSEAKSLPCPKCGTINFANIGFDWD